MSLILLIALAASIPFAGLCWAGASSVERLGAGVRLRLGAWTVALFLPIALAPTALTIGALDIRSPLAAVRTEQPALQPLLAPAVVTAVHQKVATASPVVIAPAPAPALQLQPLSWVEMILAGIAAVALLRLAALGLALRRVSRLVANSEPLEGAGYGGKAPVRQSDHDTPVLAGVRRPVVLLPRKLVTSLTPEQAALICAHEQAHLAAGDHVAHLIEEAALRLFWFNPLLGVIRSRLSAAREEACDARALATCSEETRRAYAESLLRAFRLAGDAQPVAAFTGLAHSAVSRRLRAILYPRSAVSAPAVAAAGVVAVCLAAATGSLSLALAAEPLLAEASTSLRDSASPVARAMAETAAVLNSEPLHGAGEQAPQDSLPNGPSQPEAQPVALALNTAAPTSAPSEGAPAPAAAAAAAPVAQTDGEARTLPILTAIHVQSGGKVVLRHGPVATVRLVGGPSKVVVDEAGRMTVTRCNGCDDAVVEVVSPMVTPLSVSQGGSIVVRPGFPAQASGVASVDAGGSIDLAAVSIEDATAAVKRGGDITMPRISRLTAMVKQGGHIFYRGDPALTSMIKDGGSVTRTGG